MIIVLCGSMGRLPVGGYSWMDMQYLAGLQSLGHDVYYLEDCGAESWVYQWETEQLTTGLDYPAEHIRRCLERIGCGDRWCYRTDEDHRGMSPRQVKEICGAADLLIVHGVPLTKWRPSYLRPKRRVFVDVDPGFIQISLLKGDHQLSATAERCEHLFTIAQRMGQPDCLIPSTGRRWLKTRPPIALEHWAVTTDGRAKYFTGVMQWRGFRDVEFEGTVYGQKDREFPRFADLPRFTDQPIRLAVTGTAPEHLVEQGWDVVTGWKATRTPWKYQRFIQESRAEFGVAKHGYVAMRSGWFSDRSLCYLASGRPLLIQDTGLDDWLPIGKGIVTFHDVKSAIAGIEQINLDYEGHRKAARQAVEEHFNAKRVLPAFLDAATS